MSPTAEERERARAIYMRLLSGKQPALPYIDDDTIFCVDVTLRLARHLADTFGLPRFAGAVHHRHGETSTAWIDRVARDIAAWCGGDGVEQSEERRTGHAAA